MTCTPIKDGFVCTHELVALEPFGAKVWLEEHSYFGPIFYRSENAITDIRIPSRKTWTAYEKWKEHCKTCIENAEKSTDAAPCAQKTAELTDEQIYGIFTEYGYERDLEDTSDEDFSVIRAVIAADRKLRGDA